MNYRASFEKIHRRSGIIRMHPDPGGKLGDPYDWCCFIKDCGDVAVIKGVTARPRPGMVDALEDKLAELGYQARSYERRQPGRTRVICKIIPQGREPDAS